MTAHSYGDTLGTRGLQPFLWTQFLGAFNDNLFKIVVSMLAVHAATPANAGRQLSLVGIVFILPFLLFSGYAGQLADVYSKRTVLVVTKSLEIVAAVLGLFAFISGHLELDLRRALSDRRYRPRSSARPNTASCRRSCPIAICRARTACSR